MLAPLLLIAISVWKRIGYAVIILLAGLKGIPDDYTEAARIDGANGWQVFRRITLPLLKTPLLLVAIVLTAILYQTDFYALREVGGHTIMTLAALAIVTAGVASERYMVFPGSAWARMIGDSSYSLYLLHMFIVGAAWAIVNRLDLGQAPALVLAMVIAVPTSLAAAYVSYRLFERPISNWANRRTRTPLPLRQSEVSAQR